MFVGKSLRQCSMFQIKW